MAIFCFVAFVIGYTLPNHFHLFEPWLLPLTQFDRAIPLMPWTIFIYMSEYVLFALAYFVFEEEINRNRYIWAYFGVLMTGMVLFVFFPTTYPRAQYPLPEEVTGITYGVFAWLRRIDTPANCFPSMHVACCFLTAFAFLPKGESRVKFVVFLTWSILVALSTLPTKQHYIADVVAGFVLSCLGYVVFYRWSRYMPLPEYIDYVKGKAAAWTTR